MPTIIDLTPLLVFLGAQPSADGLELHVCERDGRTICAAVHTSPGVEPRISGEWAAA